MRAVAVVRHRLRRNLRGSGVPAMGKARSLDRATVRPEEGPASAPSWRACLSLAPLLSTPLIVASDTVPRYLTGARASRSLYIEGIL